MRELRFCVFLWSAASLWIGCSPAADPSARAQLSTSADAAGGIPLGDEYSGYAKPRGAKSQSSSGSGEGGWRFAALYLPNRLIDLFDIFRVDVGAGVAYGGVIRLTKYGQAGYREISPASLRLGLRGRRAPWVLERTNEFGIGPTFLGSPSRPVTPAEVGVGVDLLIIGGYVGISLDEFADFAAGIVGVDFKDDDFQ